MAWKLTQPAANTPASDSEPAWSPDGSRVVFSTNRDGNWQLYSIRVDGTGRTRLTDTPGDEREPAWGPAPESGG